MPKAKRKKKRFPKRELNTWVRKKTCWDHSEWLNLLDDLREAGFEQWTDDPEGQDAIGLYIETKRAES